MSVYRIIEYENKRFEVQEHTLVERGDGYGFPVFRWVTVIVVNSLAEARKHKKQLELKDGVVRE